MAEQLAEQTDTPHPEIAEEGERLRSLRFSAIAVAALAALFLAFYQIPKVVPWLLAVNPTAQDPYDAIGTFGVQAACLLAALSVLRVYLPNQLPLGPGRVSSIVRMQIAVVIAVEVTLLADFVALIRHPAQWVGLTPGVAYLSALFVLDVANAWVGWLALRAGRGLVRDPDPMQSLRSLLAIVAVVATLVLFPEEVRFELSGWGDSLTVVVGAILLFVPMAELALAIVWHSDDLGDTVGLPTWLRSASARWLLVLVVGLVGGAGLVGAEALGGGGLGEPRAAAIAIYLGLETAGVAIGYAMLAEPLGVVRRNRT